MQSAPHFYPDRIGLKPCAGTCEGAGEASAGECTGQPWSWEAHEQGGGDICCRCCGAGGAKVGADANADEQSTHRTQGRERVLQALDRVRKAARLKRKEKLTALLHHINVDSRRMAFFAERSCASRALGRSGCAV